MPFYAPGQKIIMLDAWYRKPVHAVIIKIYERGLTADDERGVRYYGSFDRVIPYNHDLFAPPIEHPDIIHCFPIPKIVTPG